LNELVFYSIIALAEGCAAALKHLGNKLFSIKAEDWKDNWNAEKREKFFSSVIAIVMGDNSPLRSLALFGFHTVIYDISFTDLDEVSEAMAKITDGFRFFLSGYETVNSYENPKAAEGEDSVEVESQKELYTQACFMNRQLQMVYTRATALLVNNRADPPHVEFEKFKILKLGIA